VITRVFDAPRRLVFEAWTRPEHLMRWWGPRDLTLSRCEVDLRPGGAWRFVLRALDGNEYGFGGEYREILPPERLVYTFRFDGAPGAEAVETLSFVEKDGKTSYQHVPRSRTATRTSGRGWRKGCSRRWTVSPSSSTRSP
jgi:uncharacterized protein YndB with AHSA1/START domain